MLAGTGLAGSKTETVMKTIHLILAGLLLACLSGGSLAVADPPTTATAATPPVVVPGSSTGGHGDLSGVPDNLKTLIVGFDQTRDKFLAQQAVLLAKLKNATTDVEREKIRQQLQDNRQSFLDALKNFRGQLKDRLTALKGKVSHAEFLRIVDAAHDAATEGGAFHHKGN
jgi:hypothetical protein